MAAQTDSLAKDLVGAMQNIFGKHQGYRTTHAKGLLVEGFFTPSPDAKTLSVASHFNTISTPIIARFSVGGGFPHVLDVGEQATPKGVAIRFLIDKETHTDLISHSFNGFATRNGEDFLTFLNRLIAQSDSKAIYEKAKIQGGDTSKERQAFEKATAEFMDFIKSHPSAAVFVTGDRPNPWTYGTIRYYEPNTHVLTNSNGKTTNVRYRLVPQDGEHLYGKDELKGLAKNYLEDDLMQRFPYKPILFTLLAHIADSDDVLDDATIPYKSTTFVEVGKVIVNKVSDDNAAKQKEIAFSPNPERGGIKGITSSNDPLIQARKGVYHISSEQRRSEKQVE